MGSRSIDIMDGCQSKEIVPFYPKLGGGGRNSWWCEQGRPHPLLPTVCLRESTGKSAPPSFAFPLWILLDLHIRRDGGAFAFPFGPGRGAAAAAGTSPLPLPGSMLCPMDVSACSSPFTSVMFLLGRGEMVDKVRGRGNSSTVEKERPWRKPGECHQMPARLVTPSPGVRFSARALLILGKHFPCQRQGRGGELCKPSMPRGPAFLQHQI